METEIQRETNSTPQELILRSGRSGKLHEEVYKPKKDATVIVLKLISAIDVCIGWPIRICENLGHTGCIIYRFSFYFAFEVTTLSRTIILSYLPAFSITSIDYCFQVSTMYIGLTIITRLQSIFEFSVDALMPTTF